MAWNFVRCCGTSLLKGLKFWGKEPGSLRDELGVLEMSWEPFDYECGHSVQVRTHTGKT